LSTEVQCGRLFDIVCVYTQSYPEIRSFKEIQMTKNALPHPHSATQHSLISWPSHPLGWDDVIHECGVIGHDVDCMLFKTC